MTNVKTKEKTIINFKVDKDLKERARSTAQALGIPLGTILNAYLRNFVIDRSVQFSAPLILDNKTVKTLHEINKDIKDVKIIEQYDGCIAYDCDTIYYIRLNKGAIASDHAHKHEEKVFLMEGEADLIIGKQTHRIKAPAKIIIPPNTYHKFTAVTDLVGLEVRV